jgi:hypothetical protein
MIYYELSNKIKKIYFVYLEDYYFNKYYFYYLFFINKFFFKKIIFNKNGQRNKKNPIGFR